MHDNGPQEFNHSDSPWGSTVAQPERLTLRTLADELELSTCTVSRVLNGKAEQYRIAESTMNRVLEYARKRGFSPNLVARGLRMKRSQSIGLILPDLSNPFFSKIARSVADEAHRNKYTLEVCDSQDSIELEIEVLSFLRDRQIDGLVFCPVGNESEHLRTLSSGSLPVVFVDRYFLDLGFSYVTSDNVKAAESATQHLLDHGHRKIVCLQGTPTAITNVHRVEGFRRALRANKVRFRKEMIVGDGFNLQSGYRATRQIIEQGQSFTALLSFTGPIALGALKAIAEAGLRIPEDVSLLTFDTIEGVEYFASPLTTVYQSPRGLGEQAVKMLFDRILGRSGFEQEHLLLPTTLTQRKSVKRLPTAGT